MTDTAHNSLKARLVTGSAVGVLLAMVMAGLFIGNLYRVHTIDRYQTELDHHLGELIAQIAIDPQNRVHVTRPLSDPQFTVLHSGLYWQVEGAGQRLHSASLRPDARLAAGPDDQWLSSRVAGQPVDQRSARIMVDGRPLIVTIASDKRLLDEQIGKFRVDLTLSMVAMGLALLGGALAMVHFGLSPVRRLGKDVDSLRNGETDRLGNDVPTEFAPIVESFNAMLEGQAQFITRARTESGNLAHNLRTPLALVIDEAEQIRLGGNHRSADFLLSRCRAMQLQIDYHLARASAAGTRGAGTLTEVAPLLAQILEAMRRLHADRALSVEIDIPDGLRLPCDRGDLAEILSNLIDNAFKWAFSRIVVSGGHRYVEVRDDGPGIPPKQRAAVLGVGVRLDPATPGSGLGLAATFDLMRVYDGQLLLDVAPEGGLRAEVRF
ncbi:sensor histidine kinase [Novosphingobium kaempferiae]|uniref:sensor histidine kinase n=1 Tax=Novosphingobium kaempferiae TaxID=2896849 RepID=UPI001E3A7A7A|nr:sensor histidine kinase [Novosphingobium kaempferiae]